MLDIWLATALFCFISFCYFKLRKVVAKFLSSESFKIRAEFSELHSLKLQIEKLKQETLQRFDNLAYEKSQLLKTIKIDTEHLIEQKRKDLKILQSTKLASTKDFLELKYKRKEAQIKMHLLNHTHQLLSTKFSQKNLLDPIEATLEVRHILSKM